MELCITRLILNSSMSCHIIYLDLIFLEFPTLNTILSKQNFRYFPTAIVFAVTSRRLTVKLNISVFSAAKFSNKNDL